jgi:hypothetical protein
MFIHMRPDGTTSASSNRTFLQGVQAEIGGDVLPIVDGEGMAVRALTKSQQIDLRWLKDES